jgi:phage repressor protein C with HTH and peptisase S24 domain
MIGEGLPGTEHLINIAEKAGVNIEWLATGNGPMKKDDVAIKELVLVEQAFRIINLEGREMKFVPDPGLCHLPVLSIEAACGNGIEVEQEIATAIFSATRDWFRKELGRTPENLCLIRARGDSMADTIMPEELVFVDRTFNHDPIDGIWVFRHQGSLYIKRLQFMPDKKIQVKSDNPSYDKYIIEAPTEFKILGQVIAALPFRKL